MPFLNRKEQTLIKAINTDKELSYDQRRNLVEEINYNARLRQDGYRGIVREFLHAHAAFNSDKVLLKLK